MADRPTTPDESYEVSPDSRESTNLSCVVARDGVPTAVVMGYEDFYSLQVKARLLEHPEVIASILRSRDEALRGETSHSRNSPANGPRVRQVVMNLKGNRSRQSVERHQGEDQAWARGCPGSAEPIGTALHTAKEGNAGEDLLLGLPVRIGPPGPDLPSLARPRFSRRDDLARTSCP